jgi:hypothetical protein
LHGAQSTLWKTEFFAQFRLQRQHFFDRRDPPLLRFATRQLTRSLPSRHHLIGPGDERGEEAELGGLSGASAFPT